MKTLSARSSVVDEIVAFNRDRDPKLVRLKFRRMAKDPFAFFRGASPPVRRRLASPAGRPTSAPRSSSAVTSISRTSAPTGPTTAISSTTSTTSTRPSSPRRPRSGRCGERPARRAALETHPGPGHAFLAGPP